ncbi:unnamed protein product, partial [Porites lobata]
SGVFSTADEDVPAKSPFQRAQESIEKKFNEASQRAQERALKKLAPAPGWKPFGTPAKRRLDGKDWLIEKTGKEFHWPKMNYLGPGTQLQKRLRRGDQGVNRLDGLAKIHDIDYSKVKNLQDKWKADDKMIRAISKLPGKKTMQERIVKKIMQTKRKLKL